MTFTLFSSFKATKLLLNRLLALLLTFFRPVNAFFNPFNALPMPFCMGALAVAFAAALDWEER